MGSISFSALLRQRRPSLGLVDLGRIYQLARRPPVLDLDRLSMRREKKPVALLPDLRKARLRSELFSLGHP
jgi:hypothetical protein